MVEVFSAFPLQSCPLKTQRTPRNYPRSSKKTEVAFRLFPFISFLFLIFGFLSLCCFLISVYASQVTMQLLFIRRTSTIGRLRIADAHAGVTDLLFGRYRTRLCRCRCYRSAGVGPFRCCHLCHLLSQVFPVSSLPIKSIIAKFGFEYPQNHALPASASVRLFQSSKPI